MPGQSGTNFLIKKNGTTLSGGRTITMTVNGTMIDVSDQSDGGKIVYLDDTIIDSSLEISFEGVVRSAEFRAIGLGAASGRFMDDITIEFPNGDEISGDFVLSGYTETGAYKDGQLFTSTLTSNGAWTFTPVT